MATDTTEPSYWLNWRVLVCALVLMVSTVIVAVLIWKYEGFKRRRLERHESHRKPPWMLYQDEAWNPSLKSIHPAWLLAFRLFSFFSMLALLIANVVLDGGGIFYFYTQWTFTLVTFYFGYASLLSIYGCCKYHKDASRNRESCMSIESAEQGTYSPPNSDETVNRPKACVIHGEASVRKTAGFWVYIFQIIFQTCAGAVVLTDIVFWLILFPFTKGYKLHFLDVAMHSFNFVFLLGDTALNSLRFPLFRIAYFVLWSFVFTTYQWIIHAFENISWPYQFLDLSSSYAPLWYLGVGAMHLLCFGAFALIIRLKNFWLWRFFPDSYRIPQ